jgi:selenium-binding protein 1
LKAYSWDKKKLTPLFTVDFTKEALGRPHLMNFGQESFYKNEVAERDAPGAKGEAVAALTR